MLKKQIEFLRNRFEELNCNMGVSYDGWYYSYGNYGFCATSDLELYKSDTEFYTLLLMDYDTHTEETTIFQENIVYMEQLLKVQELKNKAEQLKEINTRIKNAKVQKLLNLALNKACTYGELKNSVTIVINIFKNNNINNLGVEKI